MIHIRTTKECCAILFSLNQRKSNPKYEAWTRTEYTSTTRYGHKDTANFEKPKHNNGIDTTNIVRVCA